MERNGIVGTTEIIPAELRDKNFRFIRIANRSKRPIDKGWSNNNWNFDDAKLQDHLKKGGNFGVVCGFNNLIVIDCDEQELCEELQDLPKTFTVKTGSGGIHLYYKCPELKKKLILDKNNKHYGEVQSWGSQVVAPGSIHPNGNKYLVIVDAPIVRISFEKLIKKLRPFIKSEDKSQMIYEKNILVDSDINSLQITNIIKVSGFKEHGHEIFGSNPWHGSETGMNFWINPSKNVAYCFRCNAGITISKAIGLNEGIITKCSDYISKDKFTEILDVAREKYGLKTSKQEMEKKTLKVLSYSELKNLEFEEKIPLINLMFNQGEIVLISARPNDFKTMGSLAMAISIASGNKFLDCFETNKARVTFIDEENGLAELKKRITYISNGMNIDENIEISFISNENLRLDDDKDLLKIKGHIKEFKPKVIFVDTLRSAVSFQENDSGSVSDFFSFQIKPLIKKYNVTLVFLHHDKKASKNGYSEADMDRVRGSSVLTAVPDNIFSFKKIENDQAIIMKHIKCRTGRRLEPQKIKVEWKDNDEKLILTCLGNTSEELGVISDCAEAILSWEFEKQNGQFTKHDVNELVSSNNWSKATGSRAVDFLIGKNRINRIKRGLYQFKASGELDDYA